MPFGSQGEGQCFFCTVQFHTNLNSTSSLTFEYATCSLVSILEIEALEISSTGTLSGTASSNRLM